MGQFEEDKERVNLGKSVDPDMTTKRKDVE
jgi:hypothetical protein